MLVMTIVYALPEMSRSMQRNRMGKAKQKEKGNC